MTEYTQDSVQDRVFPPVLIFLVLLTASTLLLTISHMSVFLVIFGVFGII